MTSTPAPNLSVHAQDVLEKVRALRKQHTAYGLSYDPKPERIVLDAHGRRVRNGVTGFKSSKKGSKRNDLPTYNPAHRELRRCTMSRLIPSGILSTKKPHDPYRLTINERGLLHYIEENLNADGTFAENQQETADNLDERTTVNRTVRSLVVKEYLIEVRRAVRRPNGLFSTARPKPFDRVAQVVTGNRVPVEHGSSY